MKNHYNNDKRLEVVTFNHHCSHFKGVVIGDITNALHKHIMLTPWKTFSINMVLQKHFGKWFKLV